MELDSSGKKKLREAQFFRGLLSAQDGAERLDSEAFDFYFSAFLSASRSVTFMLQNENKAGYDALKAEWDRTIDDDGRSLMEFMNSERVQVVHIGLSTSEREIQFVDLIEHNLKKPPEQRAHVLWIGKPGEVRLGLARHYLQIGADRVLVVEACTRYVGLLEDLVTRFYVRFPRPVESRTDTDAILPGPTP